MQCGVFLLSDDKDFSLAEDLNLLTGNGTALTQS